ncbi:Hypothetical predicted protein [Lynx pardinus]|uniref:Uncharacterized protein n=1 Tax=Lynx pardinus TaxID=191816 RepID=A0A485P301_LYNPA|nr:Hypothetical predicted protein [Lynx pardinus]
MEAPGRCRPVEISEASRTATRGLSCPWPAGGWEAALPLGCLGSASLLPAARRPRGARPPVRAAEIGGGGHVGGHVLRRARSKRKWGLV